MVPCDMLPFLPSYPYCSTASCLLPCKLQPVHLSSPQPPVISKRVWSGYLCPYHVLNFQSFGNLLSLLIFL